VFDFDWNIDNVWSMISACDETDQLMGGGGSFHMFRPIDLVRMSKEDAAAKLKQTLSGAT
jgi:hypothetical protein